MEKNPILYDEERELTRYVWENLRSLMTDGEKLVGKAILARAKAQAVTSESLARTLRGRNWGRIGDAEVEAALAGGAEAYRQRVRDRVLQEHVTEAVVNRCPRCGKVVRTPLAKQCLWCGFDWH
jgi:hypothetical protein